jgi:hypothetical protein
MSVTCRSREQFRVDIYAVFRVEDADKGPSSQISSLDIIDGDPSIIGRLISCPVSRNRWPARQPKTLIKTKTPTMALLNSTLPFGTRQQSSAKITVQVLDANDNDPSHFLSTTGGRPGDSGLFCFSLLLFCNGR